jgi:hypothetical protein
MQPCATCGSLGVDTAGFCVRCRAYRGLPAAPGAPSAPGGPLPPPGGPLPAPGGAAPAPERPRSPLLIPLIALSATLVVLVVAIVVVVAARSRDRDVAADGTLVDRCVVGTWQVRRYTEEVPVNGVGNVTFSGQGARVRLRADGTGINNYGDGTTFTATIGGVAYTLVVKGSVTFGFRAQDGTVSFTDVSAAGTETLTRADTGRQVTRQLTGSSDPARYTCAGDWLTEFTSLYRAEMSRVSRTA